MKKLVLVIISLVSALCLCACGEMLSVAVETSGVYISVPDTTAIVQTEAPTSSSQEPIPSTDAGSSVIDIVPSVSEIEPSSAEPSSEVIPSEVIPSEVVPTESEPVVITPTESVPAVTASPTMGVVDPAAAVVGFDYNTVLPIPAELTADRASAQQTMDLGGIYLKNQNQPVIYLTFTLGYETGYTQAMLDLLSAKNVQAIFFVVASSYVNANNYGLMQQMVDRGHLIGNHGYAHKYTYELSETDLINDMLMGAGAISQALGGYNVQFYRPPYGYITLRDIYLSGRLGQTCTSYSFLYYDYDANAMPTKDQALAKLVSGIQPGAVYYLHVTQCNVEALGEFIDYARGLGYTFLRLDQ